MSELVSVIIPNYNKEKYIDICINSVLQQTYPNIEIVIVDDCSTDHSRQIIKEFEALHNNITPVFLTQNSGVSYARNVGIKNANGKYITTLDSDDYYYNPYKIENEMKVILEKGDNVISYSKRILVDKNGELFKLAIDEEKRYCSGDIFYKLLTEKTACSFVQRDYCLKKESMLIAGLYEENDSYYEDYDLLLRLASEYNFYFTGESGTAYRLINDGLSTLNRKRYGQQFLVPQKKRWKYIWKLPMYKKYIALVIWLFESSKLSAKIFLRYVLNIMKLK